MANNNELIKNRNKKILQDFYENFNVINNTICKSDFIIPNTIDLCNKNK